MLRARGDRISGTTESPKAAAAPRVSITAELVEQTCPGRAQWQRQRALPRLGLVHESDPGASPTVFDPVLPPKLVLQSSCCFHELPIILLPYSFLILSVKTRFGCLQPRTTLLLHCSKIKTYPNTRFWRYNSEDIYLIVLFLVLSNFIGPQDLFLLLLFALCSF